MPTPTVNFCSFTEVANIHIIEMGILRKTMGDGEKIMPDLDLPWSLYLTFLYAMQNNSVIYFFLRGDEIIPQ